MMTKFVRIRDSEFTYHYEMNGPEESPKLRRNTLASVGPKAQEYNRGGRYGRMAECGKRCQRASGKK
jgi:hypothetical protein